MFFFYINTQRFNSKKKIVKVNYFLNHSYVLPQISNSLPNFAQNSFSNAVFKRDFRIKYNTVQSS